MNWISICPSFNISVDRYILNVLFCFILSGCATTPPGTGYQERGAEDSARYLKYVVQKGDTFWKISQMAYNDSRKWRKIYDANSDRVKDIAQLTPGDIIIIPIEIEKGKEVKR